MIGILVATDIELAAIKEIMKVDHESQVADHSFYYGTINDKDVVLAQTGVGKTHAAMTTTIMCLQDKPELIINTGTAGGLKSNQNVLDVVIGDMVIQADYDTSPIDGDKGIGLIYKMDDQLVQKAADIAKKADLKYHIGAIASQDRFLSEPNHFQNVIEIFPQSICCEMEAGAVGHIATDFGVDLILVRCLSDIVVHHDNPMEYWEYAKYASQQIAHWMTLFI